LEPAKSRKEELEKIGYAGDEKLSAEYEAVSFLYDYYDSKQLALKVLMNTFYGETGNKISPFYMKEIAGGITTAGQYNLKSAKKIVIDNECRVFYGDTDSLYISMPERYFTEIDRAFYSGAITKEKYWTDMVRITSDNLGMDFH